MEESDDAAYLKDLNLHHTLDFLIRRVLQYRPATRKGVCLVLRDSVDEILSEEDDNKMNSSKYLNNDEPNTGRRVSIPSRRESVHFLTPVDNSIDVGTVSPATANRIAAVDEALASLRQHLLGIEVDINSGIYDWYCIQSGLVTEKAMEQSSSIIGNSGHGNEVSAASVAEGVIQTAIILSETLKETISSKGSQCKSESKVVLSVAVGETIGFKEIATQILSNSNQYTDCSFFTIRGTPTHVRTTRDSFRERVLNECVLLTTDIGVLSNTSSLSPSQSQKEFEVCVSLIGCQRLNDGEVSTHRCHCFEIITSFGQVANINSQPDHLHLCSAGTVVRVDNISEAVYHFKVTMVRVVEYIIHKIIHQEFHETTARKTSEVGLNWPQRNNEQPSQKESLSNTERINV